MRTYTGKRCPNSVQVEITDELVARITYPLTEETAPRLLNEKPEGWNWGFDGQGPAQLAMAILLDATDSIEIAKRCYKQFKNRFVINWRDEWEITSEAIHRWLGSEGVLIVAPIVQIRDGKPVDIDELLEADTDEIPLEGASSQTAPSSPGRVGGEGPVLLPLESPQGGAS